MAFPNEVVLSGTLCNIEYKQANSGNFFTKGALKVYQGQDKDDAWYDIVAFNNPNRNSNLADNIADCFEVGVKSLPVVIKGKLEQSTYEKKDGTKGKNFTIIVDECAVSVVFGAVGVLKNNQPPTQPSEPQARTDYGENEAPF